MATIHATRKDPDNRLYLETIGILNAVRNLRTARASWIADAIRAHGWHGPLTSGCEQTHWPDDVKDRLRTNAREIGRGLDDAMKVWQSSGRRLHTFRAMLPAYQVEGSRY